MAKDAETQVIQLRPQAELVAKTADAVPHFVLSLAEAKIRQEKLQQFVSEFLKVGVDYGRIGGADKPTLLKPGAEKLCEIFGFTKLVEIVSQAEDWTIPCFAYIVKVRLVSKINGLIEAEGVGAANSREQRFSEHDAFSMQNTLIKMAKKRALIDAVLSATCSSGLFTQDLEDLAPQPSPKSEPAAPTEPEEAAGTDAVHEAHSENPPPAPANPNLAAVIVEQATKVPVKALAAQPMTHRQRNLILALIRQKALSSSDVEGLLIQLFGHNDGMALHKAEASQFITTLLK